MADTLVQRIRDAIRERRGLAEDAVDPLADEWFEADGLCDRGMTRPDAAFIEAHSPDAVLALCKGAETILETHSGSHECPADAYECCGWWDEGTTCPTVTALASMFGVVSSVTKTDDQDAVEGQTT